VLSLQRVQLFQVVHHSETSIRLGWSLECMTVVYIGSILLSS
jgi:hypothetical protein